LKDGATPHPNVTTTLNYSIRWEGHVVPATTGKYKFDLEFTPGDQASFYVNGQKCDTIIDSHCKLALNLEAGKPVKLLVELRHVRRSTALTLLKWSVPEKELFDPQQIIDRVKNDGTTLIILSNASSWMDIITKNTNVKYKGDFTVGTNWLGGVHFVKAHPLFKDLPVNQGMDWPYEAVVSIGSERIGLIMDGEELVAGAYHCFPQKLGTAVGVIPCGKGKIYAQKNQVVFEMGTTNMSSKLVDGVYPNYRQVIPGGCDERVTIEREELLRAVRRVSVMATDKSNAIRLTFAANQLTINITSQEVGEGRETIPVKYTGKEISIVFNPEYVMDPLKNMDDDEVYFELSDGHSPALLKCSVPFLYVLMPLRLN
jgi:hypothetical protein